MSKGARGFLEDVDDILGNPGDIPCWPRAAALVIRQGLEKAVEARLVGVHGPFIERPSFTAQLVALRSVVDRDLAREVAWTWAALSQATHAHGYGIGPTRAELMRWYETTERLVGVGVEG
jgi:hypothetical protein